MKIAVLVSFSGTGGVEKMLLNLLEGLVSSGQQVDLLAVCRYGNPPEIAGVNTVDLGVRHSRLALPGLVRYLRQARPQVLLAAKDRAIRTALLARRLAGVKTPIVGRVGTHLSASLAHQPAWRRWLRCLPIRFWYRRLDRLVAVSQGVADDVRGLTGLPEGRIRVIRNPVVHPGIFTMAGQSQYHPWFLEDIPVILGVGRLTYQKGFDVLLQAFARVRRQLRCRLVILGEGRQRQPLLDQANSLGVAPSVALPGFSTNPYAAMQRAALLVLSSRWEGSPNVLTEAMALGTPVVATDCPSGPREILTSGRLGPLVAVEDTDALAAAIIWRLQTPPDKPLLQQAVEAYSVNNSAAAYLQLLAELI